MDSHSFGAETIRDLTYLKICEFQEKCDRVKLMSRDL